MRFDGYRSLSTCAVMSFGILCAPGVHASESGQVHYPLGVNTIMNAALPGPGETGFYSYSQYYWSDRLNDGDGRSLDPNFKVEVLAEAPRIVHNWGTKIGPFFVASAAITPITHVKLQAFGRRDESTGFGDPVISPVYLYHVNKKGNFFAYFGPDIYVPIGKYDKSRLANNASHYWAVAPNASVTWLPTPKWEVSTTVYSEFNWANRATGYRSGDALSVDLAVAHRPIEALPRLKVALQGYAHKQISDDKIDGVAVPGGNRGQAFALGPQISYDIAGGRGGILLKYQREFAVENRSLGNRLWFELAFPL
ncbi:MULTISPECIES: transporter [unclassified Sphingobium]|uniref:SphA family protein n=2 Tax=unclassified Sphingobium TaxID=2611147 RepID=UPI001198E288|nr:MULTISPECIES: transporter [unclassified Sphingobium]MBG6116373.1 hypothetical protein [Sphingobium sp. JAI105]TWC95915.1 hypothetical protein FB595_1592 [Sphingobium sp. AEW010]TWD15119.1 hypothetical protein FB596_1602 [Sphingobium sp. AEW013]TWD19078.1 hypothetical protein FB594_1606 [Sphingobium sp. AEW001]